MSLKLLSFQYFHTHIGSDSYQSFNNLVQQPNFVLYCYLKTLYTPNYRIPFKGILSLNYVHEKKE